MVEVRHGAGVQKRLRLLVRRAGAPPEDAREGEARLRAERGHRGREARLRAYLPTTTPCPQVPPHIHPVSPGMSQAPPHGHPVSLGTSPRPPRVPGYLPAATQCPQVPPVPSRPVSSHSVPSRCHLPWPFLTQDGHCCGPRVRVSPRRAAARSAPVDKGSLVHKPPQTVKPYGWPFLFWSSWERQA